MSPPRGRPGRPTLAAAEPSPHLLPLLPPPPAGAAGQSLRGAGGGGISFPRLDQGPRGAASSGAAAELGGRRIGWRVLVCGAVRPAGRGGTSLERAGRWRRGVLRGGSEAAASLVRTALLRRRGVLVGEVGRIPSAARAARSRWALVMARGGPGLPSSDRRRSGPLVMHDLRPAWISGVHAPADVVAGSEVAAGCLAGGNPWPPVAVTASMASRTPFPPWWRRRG